MLLPSSTWKMSCLCSPKHILVSGSGFPYLFGLHQPSICSFIVGYFDSRALALNVGWYIIFLSDPLGLMEVLLSLDVGESGSLLSRAWSLQRKLVHMGRCCALGAQTGFILLVSLSLVICCRPFYVSSMAQLTSQTNDSLSRFRFDSVHPSQQIFRNFGREMAKAVNNTSPYMTWFS